MILHRIPPCPLHPCLWPQPQFLTWRCAPCFSPHSPPSIFSLIYTLSGLRDTFSLFSENNEQAMNYISLDLVFCACLGVICGLLGSLFVGIIASICTVRNRSVCPSDSCPAQPHSSLDGDNISEAYLSDREWLVLPGLTPPLALCPPGSCASHWAHALSHGAASSWSSAS